MFQFKKQIFKSQIEAVLLYWVIVPGVVVLLGMGVDSVFGFKAPEFALNVRTIVAVVLFFVGLFFIFKSMRDFEFYGEGTPNPLMPPKRLVTQGVYSLCRNPMFFGYDLAALGVLLLWGSPGALAVSYPLFIFLQVLFLKKKEEPSLQRRYGREFTEYCSKVPFLLPFLKL